MIMISGEGNVLAHSGLVQAQADVSCDALGGVHVGEEQDAELENLHLNRPSVDGENLFVCSPHPPALREPLPLMSHQSSLISVKACQLPSSCRRRSMGAARHARGKTHHSTAAG